MPSWELKDMNDERVISMLPTPICDELYVLVIINQYKTPKIAPEKWLVINKSEFLISDSLMVISLVISLNRFKMKFISLFCFLIFS